MRRDDLILKIGHADLAYVMHRVARREHFGMRNRVGAILQHAHALAGHQRQRQIIVGIVARNQAIDAVIGEEIRPTFDVTAVQNIGVFVVELLNYEAQFARQSAVDRLFCRLRLRRLHQNPISSR